MPISTSAILTEDTGNRKLGPGRVAVTHVSQATCPPECPFRNAGCYAETGPQGMWVTGRLNASDDSHHEAALQEAAAIDGARKFLPLRLHGVGDCRTVRDAKIVAAASRRYKLRAVEAGHDEPRVWGYTHAWRRVRRSDWSGVSMLASCERVGQVEKARRRGFAAALVVADFEKETAYDFRGERLIPCPAQTGRSDTCADCRLCWDADRLFERRLTIAFKAHGSKATEVKRRVNLL